MARFYDARGNIYAVIAPDALRTLGVPLPQSPAEAAATRQAWAAQAVTAICDWPAGQRPPCSKSHRSDGLLVGPFQDTAPFDLLIVNTDGTLAERSGNGLTIFAQSLTDSTLITGSAPFTLRVHHDNADSLSPVATQAVSAAVEDVNGFWLDIGAPGFGRQAVGATGPGVSNARLNGRKANRVEPIAALHPAWQTSVFVRVGNPHCVTLVADVDELPSFEDLHEPELYAALTRIAFIAGKSGSGDPCPGGVNLQWAARLGPNRIAARVFERGEGPTASSGTSASAVASAAWFCGWVQAGLVEVVMPGGTAPLRLIERDGQLQQVQLFGTARVKA
ncbi:diaminopimelate epimerase [Pseudomonas sp. KU26590]|uniref:diaminopimelate epimerase n=1 Tax=Pseudomonas sp. KU26590 TaxID=2991051 RepID=UPI00223E26E2|nr:diaminopimelate epimerase [Pseudomonas sp. KU26590]UZJ61703.1 diaminopimelate epimerase [Pseudomonas sp. KU26590]